MKDDDEAARAAHAALVEKLDREAGHTEASILVWDPEYAAKRAARVEAAADAVLAEESFDWSGLFDLHGEAPDGTEPEPPPAEPGDEEAEEHDLTPLEKARLWGGTGVFRVEGERGPTQQVATARVARVAVSCFDARVRRGPGGPWVFLDGVWVPGWSSEAGKGGPLGQVLLALLVDDYRKTHENTVFDVLARSPELGEMAAHPIEDGWSEYINFSNGLLHWPTGEFGPHDPEVLSTWQLPVVWDPDAKCPLFERFVGEVLPEDMLEPRGPAGVCPWQEDIGYSMLPGNPLHSAMLLRGSGRNGKGVYMRINEALLGDAFVSNLSLEDLTEADRKFRLEELVGSALNIAGEVDPKYLRSTAMFKMLTGGDRITVEEKYRLPFRYTPWAWFLFSANADFAVSDKSVAFFERWQVRSFPRFIPEERRDKHLADRIIAAELPGIAVKAVAGLRTLMARGYFDPPESARLQKDEFRRNADHVLRFVGDCIVWDASAARVKRSAIHMLYVAWCVEEGIPAKVQLGQTALLASLRRLAEESGGLFAEARARGEMWVSGIALREVTASL